MSEPGPPPDRESHDDLRKELVRVAGERYGAPLAAGTRRRTRVTPRRVARAAALAVLAILGVCGGIGYSTGAFDSDHGGSVTGDAGAPGHGMPAKPGTGVKAKSRVPNPGGGAPWGLSAYDGETGDRCVVVGRVVGGVLGVIENGVFTRLSRAARASAAFCDDLTRDHLIFTVNVFGPANGSRTLLYGQVDRVVQGLELVPPPGGQGDRRTVAIAADSSFLAVQPGINALRGWQLVVRVPGQDRTIPLGET